MCVFCVWVRLSRRIRSGLGVGVGKIYEFWIVCMRRFPCFLTLRGWAAVVFERKEGMKEGRGGLLGVFAV